MDPTNAMHLVTDTRVGIIVHTQDVSQESSMAEDDLMHIVTAQGERLPGRLDGKTDEYQI